MPQSTRLQVMISSKCDIQFSDQENESLSELRIRLKKYIQGMSVGDETLFDVWINEEEPPQGGNWNSEEVCLNAVRESDILLVLYNGDAGWASSNSTVGICHAEVKRGLDSGASKVRLIQLPEYTTADENQLLLDNRFREYIKRHNLFRGARVNNVDELLNQVGRTLRNAVVELARGGVREASRGRGDAGDALDWNRLGYAARRNEMRNSILTALSENGATSIGTDSIVYSVAGEPILFVVDAVPAAFGVPAARELVGQPFLNDHERIKQLKDTNGPVHLIACHKNATESQAIRMLGFPDATVLATPFGVYVADPIQKIQFVILTHCQDDTNTRFRLQSFLEWLNRSDEDRHIAERAVSRQRIVEAIAGEQRT